MSGFKAGVKRECGTDSEKMYTVRQKKKNQFDTVKARKLAYYGHTTRKQGSCLEKEIISNFCVFSFLCYSTSLIEDG